MSTNFPVALDSLTNPLGSDSMAVVSHAAQHTNANDAIEALQVRVGITGSTDPASLTYRVSADGEGAALAALAAKTTPVDDDLVGLSDSAAGGALKKLSWSSIKTVLQSVFATLAGIAGGQTLNGGTGASETLTLRSTAHATKGKILFGTSAYDEATNDLGLGTVSPSARLHVIDTTEQQRLGYDAATYLSMTVSNLGAVTYSATGGQYILKGINSTATLGSDLVTNGAFTSDLSSWTGTTNWSWSAGAALHTAGSVVALSQNISVTSGQTYLVEVVISGRTAGSVSLALGAVSVIDYSTVSAVAANITFKRTVVAGASGSVALTITPSSPFNGSVDSVVVRNVTLGSVTPTLVLQNSDASLGFHTRSGGSSQFNTFIGNDAGRSILTGYNNSTVGCYSQRAVTTGVNNTSMGYSSLNVCTVGSLNTAIGSGAGQAITSGYSNCLFGYQAGAALTTAMYAVAIGPNALSTATAAGDYSTAVGYASMLGLTSGTNNVSLGAYSGRYIADGATANATCNNSVFVGYSAKALASGQTNQNVFGYNAIGLGSNTSVIGSSATVTFKAFGTPILTPAASSVPTVNGELTIEATSNTSLTFRLKGSDGTVRSASLTLA